MDSKSHPLVNLYCEDQEAEFILKNMLNRVNADHKNFHLLVNIIKSGPINQVENDYLRHKRNFSQMRMKIGYCCVFDGDYKNDANYSNYHENDEEFTMFLYPYMAPEKFLVTAYLKDNEHRQLQAALNYSDHHTLFQEMVHHGLAATREQAKTECWNAFKETAEYEFLFEKFKSFITETVKHFSGQSK